MQHLATQKLARLTGLFYLLIIAGGLFSGIAVRGTMVDFSNPGSTLEQIMQQESFYRIGFMADLIMVISDVMVSLLFYYLLRRVNQVLAVFAAVFRLIQSAILGVNLIHLFSPILLINGNIDLGSAEMEVLANQVVYQLQVFEYGYLISGVFFAINCFLMGYLIYKAEFLPSFLGIAIALAGGTYFFNCMANFMVPSLAMISQMLVLFIAIFAEVSLCLYLLIKGIKTTTSSSPAFA